MHIAGLRYSIKPARQTCSSITIPKGLRQHPISVVIIHSAIIIGLRRKLPDPSDNFSITDQQFAEGLTLRFLKWIDTINEWIGNIFCSTLIIIMIFAVYEVVRRYFFSNPTTWVWEINSQLLCLMGALAGGYALLHNSHVSVDIVVTRLSERSKAVLNIITSPIFFLFSGCLIWYGTKEAYRAYSVNQHVISQFASPLWPIKSIIALGGILIFLQGVSKLIQNIRIVLGEKDQS